jgi:hypothetical protein
MAAIQLPAERALLQAFHQMMGLALERVEPVPKERFELVAKKRPALIQRKKSQ